MYNADELFAVRDQQLFKAMGHCNHCLHHLLPPVKKVCYNLITPSYELIVHKLKQTRCSYLVRMVFENVPVKTDMLLLDFVVDILCCVLCC